MLDGRQQSDSNRRWGIVAMLMAITFMGHFNRYSISVAGTEVFIPKYHIDPVQMGWVYSAFLTMYMLCMTPGGWLIDRIGGVKTLAFMGFSFAVFQACTGAATWLTTPYTIWIGLLVIRSLAGISSAPLHPGASRVISRWMPRGEQPFANGLVTATAILGAAFTYYIFGYMVEQLEMPLSFAVAGGVTLTIATIWIIFASEFPNKSGTAAGDDPVQAELKHLEHEEVEKSTSVWSLLNNRNLIFLTASYAAAGYFQYLFNYWTEFYFNSVLKLSVETSREYTTIALLGMAAGMFVGGVLTQYLSQIKLPVSELVIVPVAGLLLSATTIIAAEQAKQPQMVLFWLSLALAGNGMCEGPMWTLAIRLGRKQGATAAGIFNTGGNLGGIIAPIITPAIGEKYGWNVALWLASAICVLGAAFWFWIKPEEAEQSES